MRRTKWTREIIIKQVQEWHAAGVPVKWLWRNDQSLTASAAILFGSWRGALEAAGFQSVRPRRSREEVIEEMRECRRSRRRLSDKLRSAAIRKFGSIGQAYVAAGLQSPRRPHSLPLRNWTPAQTITAIRDRHNSGKSLTATWREDPALFSAARRIHGHWTAAVRAAGLAPPTIERLSAVEVLHRIQERQRTGSPLSNMDLHDPRLALAASRHFGGWSKALSAAGVVTTIPVRWSKRKVVEGMRARHQRGEALCTTWKEDKLLFAAATRYFGSWSNAMRAASFEPIHRERWSKDRVIERLQAWAARGEIRQLRKIDPCLSAAAFRFFGSHQAALEAASLEPARRIWTEARVVATIQDHYVAGAPLHSARLIERSLVAAAKRRFGSWPAAIEAAGLHNKIALKELPRRWSRELVIQEILAWHRSGRSLAEIHCSNRSLNRAAKKWFGSWRAALRAAGLDSKRRAWSKQAVIDEILDRYRDGRPLSSDHPSNTNLASAARRYLGSWRDAIAAAGVQSQRAKSKGA